MRDIACAVYVVEYTIRGRLSSAMDRDHASERTSGSDGVLQSGIDRTMEGKVAYTYGLWAKVRLHHARARSPSE